MSLERGTCHLCAQHAFEMTSIAKADASCPPWPTPLRCTIGFSVQCCSRDVDPANLEERHCQQRKRSTPPQMVLSSLSPCNAREVAGLNVERPQIVSSLAPKHSCDILQESIAALCRHHGRPGRAACLHAGRTHLLLAVQDCGPLIACTANQ